MDMLIRPVQAEEQKYAYAQSHQIDNATGVIGHLRGDFGREGTSFYVTWWDKNESLKSDVFKAELDDVINALRLREEYGFLLGSRSAMQSYAWNHPDSKLSHTEPTQYGFRIDTTNYAYILRCNPIRGDYNFYCRCFVKPLFDLHLQHSRKGIRFITPNYKEFFRIPDGDSIRITKPDGETEDFSCRYLDDSRFEMGWLPPTTYHIYEFATDMERSGSTVIPLRSSLPQQCYGVLAETGKIIIYKKGESGYYKTDIYTTSKAESLELAEEHNAIAGISKAQAAAMQAGSLFGWHTPAADPANYDENGQPMKPRHRARDDAR